MNENKQNTTLLTVVAVATLLVAVVGATFAYFTASNANNSTSIIQANSGKMVITFADGTNDTGLLTESGFQPGNNVLVNKTFTVVGNNTAKASGVSAPVGTDTTGIAMPYYVGLRYTNEFSNDNNEGGLIYRIKGDVTKIDNQDYADVHYTGTADGDTGYYTAAIPTSRTNGTSRTTSGDVSKIATSKDDYIRLAYGVFQPYSAAVTITFNFQILFPDNGKNQDSNKGCSFTGRIVINDIATGGEATSNITTQGA